MTSQINDSWKRCPPGTIHQMLNVLDEGRRRRRATRVAMMSIFICGGGFGVWTHSPAEYDYGGILCSEVRRLSPDFMEGILDEKTTVKIEAHLRACPSCGPAMQNKSADIHATHNNPTSTMIAVNEFPIH